MCGVKDPSCVMEVVIGVSGDPNESECNGPTRLGQSLEGFRLLQAVWRCYLLKGTLTMQCKQELFSWFLFFLIAHALSRTCLFLQGGITFIWIFFSLTKRMLDWTSFPTWFNFADAITDWCQPYSAEYGASPVITELFWACHCSLYLRGTTLCNM